MFKSGEERDAERRERDEQRAQQAAADNERVRQEQEARQRAAFLASPVGGATAAKQAGDKFFEVQLPVGSHSGRAGFGTVDSRSTTMSSADTLAAIEDLGWHLEHASYFFMITSESSTDRVFNSGQATAIQGVTMGVYLFRNTGTPAAS
ncbi:MAG: hypothetical protein ACTHJM_10640 [Marmoricola sp.]